jgi:hypothetical protein
MAFTALVPIGPSASTQEEACSVVFIDEDFAERPGWSIQTCSNGEITYISPIGNRCITNEQLGVLACEGMGTMKGLQNK